MSKLNNRQIILTNLKHKILERLLACQLLMVSQPNPIFNIVTNIPEIAMYQIISSQRYLSARSMIPRALYHIDWLMNKLDNDRFRQELRVNKDSFCAILAMIQGHWVFRSNSSKKQTEPGIQIMVALERLGMYSTSAFIGWIARLMSISEGSVNNFSWRFIFAIMSIEKEYVIWLDVQERKIISNRIK
ncbi:hypothetical protein PHYBLDRAFT_171005 [Phycomyces blakesleeanus NRRL 1555(-)]|uniref:Uncharacterized protein n=1 Tax=Phycomyces blakesleeanus (strain ATCC 8743b / DSM 1359 / FGSC 10004 / NBRC 33097 / NRRL 1555) TaxID=763407 RepID=A0A167LQX9_PHYB8|nr:hypothetical protein PHYBLDRAFT_171005 [Phycomyces blakesleeanus NRRL 1555(-)]OAD70928.1 hypothetical protein PHYBLDRAFT_171005 [Phycomyces blakesleeanus NRRL 1555(-)]|eukprot:XP_018288968.1 hypothetical protein PHYBLDRAFT_171005 [Phycomyces blakesleeanus NRRL 1555(-)]